MEVRCLLNTTFKPNVQNGVARCNKTLNKYITKSGEYINEVICDYGKGLVTKSEISPNKIVNTCANGDIITYTKNYVGDVFVNDKKAQTICSNTKVWDNLLANIYKGF